MSNWKYKLYIITKEFFQFSLVIYLLLSLLELFKRGFVSFFFDNNILLAVVLLSGVAMTLTYIPLPLQKKQQRITSNDVQNNIAIALIGGILVYVKFNGLGITSYIAAGATVITIFSLSVILFFDDER